MFVTLTYWDWTPSLNYDKLYLNKCGQTTVTERKQLRTKRKSSNKIQNLWNKFGLSGCLVGVWLLNSNSFPPPFCFSDTTFAFAETGTFNINGGRNANENYLLSSDSRSDGLCGVRNRANQPWMKTSTCVRLTREKTWYAAPDWTYSFSHMWGKRYTTYDWFTSVCERKFTLRLFRV